nr:glycosyltransferase family 4 protein [Fredinandcohnia onubensis]
MNHKTIVVGLEHFIDKIGYQAMEYRRIGIPVKYLVMDKSGLSKTKAEKYKADVEVVPKNIKNRILETIQVYNSYKPKWTEIYDIGKLTFIYGLIAKLFGTKLIFILRGGELAIRDTKFDIRRWGLLLTLKMSNHIIAKEINIMNDLDALNIPKNKITHLPNCVPVPEIEKQEQEKDIDILFLNSVRKMRNVDILVEALHKLLSKKPDLNIVITGFTTLDDNEYKMDPTFEQVVLARLKELNYSQIHYQGFEKNPESLYKRAKIFVLPADVIYLNYSLLESMSYGVAPVVGDGEGAELIIDDHENGRISKRDADALCQVLYETIDEQAYEKFGENARNTIINKFSIEKWGERMLEVRKGIKG